MNDTKRRQFVCAGCGWEFNTETTEEEKNKEFYDEYGHSEKDSDEEVVSICDNCHVKFKGKIKDNDKIHTKDL